MFTSPTTVALLVLGSLVRGFARPLVQRLPSVGLRSRDVDVPTLSSFLPIDEPLLQLVRTRARDVSLKSWELGTLAEAYLEIGEWRLQSASSWSALEPRASRQVHPPHIPLEPWPDGPCPRFQPAALRVSLAERQRPRGRIEPTFKPHPHPTTQASLDKSFIRMAVFNSAVG